MGFCSDDDVQKFLAMAPSVEQAMVDSGIILLKYWLDVDADEQTRRLEARMRRRSQDLEADRRWTSSPTATGTTTRVARDEMFAATHTHVGALERRRLQRQAARPPQHHQPPARLDPLRARPAAGGALPHRQRDPGYVEPEPRFDRVPSRY